MDEPMRAEGFWKECPRCKGTGKETVSEGILQITTKEIDCQMCGGAKKMFFTLKCSRMSLGQIYLHGTNITRGYHFADCMGYSCHLWDHEHGGGCLERKALLLQIQLR